MVLSTQGEVTVAAWVAWSRVVPKLSWPAGCLSLKEELASRVLFIFAGTNAYSRT